MHVKLAIGPVDDNLRIPFTKGKGRDRERKMLSFVPLTKRRNPCASA